MLAPGRMAWAPENTRLCCEAGTPARLQTQCPGGDRLRHGPPRLLASPTASGGFSPSPVSFKLFLPDTTLTSPERNAGGTSPVTVAWDPPTDPTGAPKAPAPGGPATSVCAQEPLGPTRGPCTQTAGLLRSPNRDPTSETRDAAYLGAERPLHYGPCIRGSSEV